MTSLNQFIHVYISWDENIVNLVRTFTKDGGKLRIQPIIERIIHYVCPLVETSPANAQLQKDKNSSNS
jgi:hypothetical protein